MATDNATKPAQITLYDNILNEDGFLSKLDYVRSWCAYRCILGNTGRRQSEYLLISSFLTGKTIGIRQENGSKMFNIRYFFSIDKFVFSHITALHIRSIAVSQSCQRRGHDQPIYGLICARLICTLHDLLKLHPLDRITGKVKYMMKHITVSWVVDTWNDVPLFFTAWKICSITQIWFYWGVLCTFMSLFRRRGTLVFPETSRG